VHVVEAQNNRLHPAELFEESRQLALESFLRAARRLGRQTCRGRFVVGRRHDLRVPARRECANETCKAPKLLVFLQTVERFEHRQIRFAPRQPFRASTASDAHGLLLFLELLQECIDECRLAHAGFRGDHDEPPLPALRPLEFVLQRVDLLIAPDDVAGRAAAGLRDGDGG